MRHNKPYCGNIKYWIEKKQYNQEKEMIIYLKEKLYKDSSVYDIYWFLGLIDITLNIPLKERI